MSTEASTDSFEVRTKDMNQAAYIWCLDGARLEGLEASAKTRDSDRSTVHFKFRVPFTQEQFKEILIKYANGEAKVDPKQYCGRQNDLRDMLHQTLSQRTKNVLKGSSN